MINTKAEFQNYISRLETAPDYRRPLAFGIGLRKRKESQTLEVLYPVINWGEAHGTAAILKSVTNFNQNVNGYSLLEPEQIMNILAVMKPFLNDEQPHPNIEIFQLLKNHESQTGNYHSTDLICYFLYDKDSAVESAEEGYFKVQCLSQLKVRPHHINVNGIFGKMNNVAWTNKGPILPQDIAKERIKWSCKGEELVVSHVDKFPYMVNFHVPEGVRVVSGSKVRLGAHLSNGTTVMPAGYVNFNAGTLGNAMIEGRISAGVVVDTNSDVGGGASIMGTLSGGNKNVISIGKKCLLGANAGTGISLGDGCTIAAGTYLTAASKISLYDAQMNPVNLSGQAVSEGENVVKGMDLNGHPYLLYLTDSLSGKIIARPNTKVIELNKNLHG